MKWFNTLALLLLSLLMPFAGILETSPAASQPGSAIDLTCSPVSQHQQEADELPLRIFETATQPSLPMMVYVSGDGGWNNFSSSLCNSLNQKGVPVVALDARKYFWKGRLPDETAKEMAMAIEKYLVELKREKFVLAGFSFGADIIPFIVNRMPVKLRAGLSSAILISPDMNCDFEIHLSDMLSLGITKGHYDVVGEIAGSSFRKYAILFGSDENNRTRSVFGVSGVKIKILPGNHHFDSAFESVADFIMSEIR